MDESNLFVDVVIVAMYVLLAVTLGLSLWSACHGVKTHQRQRSTRIAYGVAAGVGLTLLLTYLTGSTRPLPSNGSLFADPFWLRVADMFIRSSILIVIACSVVIVIAKFRR
jgi:uncharacterized membrane protein